MIHVDIMDPNFNPAYCNAMQALPVHELESPRQYRQRWCEAYRCGFSPDFSESQTFMVFERDEDYTWFMLRWG
jgi:hypothetical protein